MKDHCLPIVKALGVASLGTLGLSLSYDAYQKIPSLIALLLCREPGNVQRVTSQSLRSVSVAAILGSVGSALLGCAYKFASPGGDHPYLIYASVGGVLALAWYVSHSSRFLTDSFHFLEFLMTFKKVTKWAKSELINSCLWLKSAVTTTLLSTAPAVATIIFGTKNLPAGEITNAESNTHHTTELPLPIPSLNHENDGEDYVNILHTATTSLSQLTPDSSASTTPSPSLVKDEVADTLERKIYIYDLERMRHASIVSGVIAAIAFAMSATGLVGEYVYTSWST